MFYNESDDDAGIKIGDDYQDGTYINYEQSSGDVEVEDEQHILGTGLEITDTDRQAASFILPEDYRNALTRIGTTVENDDIPDDGMEVGDSVTIGYDDVPAEFNGYEVTSIDWNIDFEVEDVVGTVENYEDFYTAKSYLGNDDPAEMIMDDTEPGVAQYRIVVGGPYVNALAEQFDTADDLQEAGDSVIAAEDNDLLVAGYLKEDTVDAADDLINRLTG